MTNKRTKESLSEELEELRGIRDRLLSDHLSLIDRYDELSHEKDLLSVQFQKAKNLAHVLIEEGARLVYPQKKKEGR